MFFVAFVAGEPPHLFDESVNKLYVMANESYEDFARALQNEYEEECGVTFGKVPITAFAKIIQVVDGEERPIGHEVAITIRDALLKQKMLDAEGRIPAGVRPEAQGLQAGTARGASRAGAGSH